MKNIVFRSLILIIVSSYGILNVNALTNQALYVKLLSSPDADYNTSIDVVNNNGTEINFKVQTVMEPLGTGNYSIAFPAGFSYNSNSLIVNNPACTGSSITTSNDSTFAFDINAIGAFCVYDYILTYTVTNSVSVGSEIISIIGGTNPSVTIGITSQNTVTKAETIDNNDNGYIDGYKLTFSTGGLLNFSNTNLTIGTLTPSLSSVVDNIVYLNFTDNVYASSERPQIIDTDGVIFTGIGVILGSTISEEDKASPIVLTINGTNIVGVGSPSINLSGNSKLVIEFSEKMSSNSLLSGFTITEDSVDITNSNYITFNENDGNTMYYCLGGYDGNGDCVTDFDSSKSYSININNNAIDLNSNTYNGGAIDVDIIVDDTTPPIASNISYNSETNNGIIIRGILGSNNYTNSTNGILNISIGGTDNNGTIQSMCVSEDSGLTNNNVCDTSWEPYSTSKIFTFTGIEGVKTLYIKFRDPSGNISNVFNDSIIWDKSSPNSSASPNGGFFINGSTTVTMNCSDSISSCNTIYYTVDGSNPTTSSSQIVPGNTISISGNNETKTLKFFAVDVVGNQEGSTNSLDFAYGDSYITFTNPILNYSNSNITLTGTCNYALGSNVVEYSINGSGFVAVTTDTCDASNTWSNNFTLSDNISNNLVVRLINDPTFSTDINVIHDNIAPNNTNIAINNNDSYSSSNNVNLTISASDTNGVSDMCISTDSGLTNNSTCNSSTWESYSNTKNYSFVGGDGTKSVYVKFRDELGNISNVANDSIIVDSSIPSVSSSLPSGTYNGIRTIALTSSDTIYYTLDGSNPTDSSTLYTTSLSFGATTETVVLKIIAYSNSSQTSSVGTYNYTFACSPASVSNGSVASYPTCTITCNNGYNLSGNSCVLEGGGGGSSGGGGDSQSIDYDDIKFLSKIKIILENIIENETINKYGILDLSNLSSGKITGVNGIINLRSSLKSKSYLIIPEKTSVLSDVDFINAPFSLDLLKYLELKTLKLNNIDFSAYNIKKLFFVGNQNNDIKFDNELDLYFSLGDKISGEVNVYYSNELDGNFEILKSGLETDNNGIINIKTKKLGYFAIVRDIYVDKYLDEKVILSIKDIDDVKKIVNDLKSNVSNTLLRSIITRYGKKLEIPDIYKYLQFDTELQLEYSKVINGFSDFITNINKYLSSKSTVDRNAAINGYKAFLKVSDLKDFKKKYISTSNIDGLDIYRTNYESIATLMGKLEIMLLSKYKRLLDTNTISNDEYINVINEYNNFIYNYTIFKQYNHKQSGVEVMSGLKDILRIYKISEGSRTAESIIQKVLIKDKYTFSRPLSYGMYNQDVKNLQEIMKSYGYFTYPQTTLYFGDVTLQSLINFSNEVLGVSNPSGILTNDLIEKMYLLEYKE